jgi:Protein of unknown function (DUF2809)
MPVFRFKWTYFLLFLLLLLTEIYIGAFVHDRLIRPVGGDYLVVILLYCLVRSLWEWPVAWTALAVLIFAYMVETTQYFRLADALGLGRHSLARIIIGSSFSWGDIIAYTAGIGTVLGLESIGKKREASHE